MESDSEQLEEDKYLQRLILCRKKTYESSNNGHSLSVNFKTVHLRDFQSGEFKYPLLRVKDGIFVSNDSDGSTLSKRNLVKYELTREQYSKRNALNSKRKELLQSKSLLF